MPLKTSDAGIDLICNYEGVRLQAYPDPATGGDPWTIGYGSTRNVHPGMVITLDEAKQRLREDLEDAEKAIARLVKAPLDQSQFDALVSLVFNIGEGNFAKSTLLKKINAHDYLGASGEFVRWNRAAGKPMLGLTRRRAAERDHFLRG
jgi:lysozyme